MIVRDNVDYVRRILDMFEGKISITEIYSLPIPRLEKLITLHIKDLKAK